MYIYFTNMTTTLSSLELFDKSSSLMLVRPGMAAKCEEAKKTTYDDWLLICNTFVSAGPFFISQTSP